MITLEININCGEKTCASEPNKFCKFCGAKKFGQIPICSLFPSENDCHTELIEINGWIQRCKTCLQSQISKKEEK